MRSLLTVLIVVLSLNLFAQSEEKVSNESQNDSIFLKNLSESDSSSWHAVKVFYNKRPEMNKPKKQPVYRQFKVIGGIIFAAAGTTDFSNIEKPFTFGQNLMPNICIITNKTYHNFAYGLANNTIKIVNGYPFGEKGLDVYVIPGINLNSGVVSTALGIEKMVKAGNVNFFMFTEVGKDLTSESKLTLSIGFHVNIQGVLIQHKGREIFYKE